MMNKTKMLIYGALLGFIVTEGDKIIDGIIGHPIMSYSFVIGIVCFAVIEYKKDISEKSK